MDIKESRRDAFAVIDARSIGEYIHFHFLAGLAFPVQHLVNIFRRRRVERFLAAQHADRGGDVLYENITPANMENLLEFFLAELAFAADFTLGHDNFLLLISMSHPAGRFIHGDDLGPSAGSAGCLDGTNAKGCAQRFRSTHGFDEAIVRYPGTATRCAGNLSKGFGSMPLREPVS